MKTEFSEEDREKLRDLYGSYSVPEILSELAELCKKTALENEGKVRYDFTQITATLRVVANGIENF